MVLESVNVYFVSHKTTPNVSNVLCLCNRTYMFNFCSTSWIWHIYYLSNDTNVIIFGSKLTNQLGVRIFNIEPLEGQPKMADSLGLKITCIYLFSNGGQPTSQSNTFSSQNILFFNVRWMPIVHTKILFYFKKTN